MACDATRLAFPAPRFYTRRNVRRPRIITSAAEATRIAEQFPSYRDFVDDALFHPAWGYYSTGQVRFGEGGHYDTFPLALSPLFGRMVARYAYRIWRRAGVPARFEICELGAGNGQLCLDVLIATAEPADGRRDWTRFVEATRYRIVERSPALVARQRATLGALASAVTWTNTDLSQRPARGAPFADAGVVIANEVLDCLSHHKVVPRPDGPGVVYVLPWLPRGVRASGIGSVEGPRRMVPRAALPTVVANQRLRQYLHFDEVVLPVRFVPAVQAFLHRYYPELFYAKTFRPYFACPAIAPLVRNTACLYRQSECLWIDYGDAAAFHRNVPEGQRVFAGPPRSGADIYRDPGRDDITFLVDFTVVATAAADAGMRVKFFGEQGELGRRSGVELDAAARDLILRYRTLGWMLALAGVGPERAWRHTGLTWPRGDTPRFNGRGGRLRTDVNNAIAEFTGKRRSNFKLMILEHRRRGVPRTDSRGAPS